jgi:putative FmdB family regulatory protein
MPLYEYACASCQKKIEVLQGFNEKPLKNCPHCGGKLRKLMSSPAIQFKGSGWYVTDYAKQASPPAEGSSEKGSEKSSEKGSEKGSEKASDKGSDKSTESRSDSRELKTESKKSEKPAKKESSSKKE